MYGRTVVKRDEVAYRRSSSKIVPITSGSIVEDRWPINICPYTRYRRINRVPIKFNFLRLPWLLNFLINPTHLPLLFPCLLLLLLLLLILLLRPRCYPYADFMAR